MNRLIEKRKNTALSDLKKIREDYKQKIGNAEYIFKLVNGTYCNLMAQSQSGQTILTINGVDAEYIVKQYFFNDEDVNKKPNKLCEEFRAGPYAVSLIQDINGEISKTNDIKKMKVIISKNGSLLSEKRWPKEYINLGKFGYDRYPFSSDLITESGETLQPPTGELIYDGSLEEVPVDGLKILELMATYSSVIFDGFIDSGSLKKLVSAMMTRQLETGDDINQLINNMQNNRHK